MSPRKSNLSLNQKITISLAILGILVTLAAAFISGHDWFADSPSLSEVNTAGVTPSPGHASTAAFTANQTSTYTPTPSRTDLPAPDPTSQIVITTVASSSGSLAPVSSTSCLWMEASGRGASIDLLLEGESSVEMLRVALFGNFVTKIRLTFSDGSQQTKDLILIRDYEYQDVVLQPVRTSSVRVEVLDVQDQFASNFGICHIEVFGTKTSGSNLP